MPMDERVLCIPAEHYRDCGGCEGFTPISASTSLKPVRLLTPSQFQFLPRSQVETDPAFLQLIPYVVLRCGSELFHYRRGMSGTETRLRALRSVGIGGHISVADAAGGTDPYETGLLREVAEEVDHAEVVAKNLLGFIFDPRTLVGRVHLGIVHTWDLQLAEATPREEALADCGFAPLEQLRNEAGEFETWSQFVLEVLSGFPADRPVTQ